MLEPARVSKFRLSDRFEEADVDPVSFHCSDHAETHGGDAYTGANRDKHDSACHWCIP